ncbi:MAG: hypothetical protein M1838_005777 [Thelocarpon superellum]|nr:MAG: hypothetical protein M1838_005777 [Thelocarpon superellum]
MRLSSQLLYSIVAAGVVGVSQAASSWGFDEGTVSVQGKSSVGGFKEKLSAQKALSGVVTLGPSDTLKVLLTTQEDGKTKRPHQAFLSVKDVDSGLETSYALSVRESGKGKVELTQKDLPVQFVKASQPLQAKIILGSFGSAMGYDSPVFSLDIMEDPDKPVAQLAKPLRYGKLEEIHHIFRVDPTSPPKIISLVFAGAVLVTIPILFGVWLTLGANVNHLSPALSSAPLSHLLFFGSVVAMEGIFFLYYYSWNLFQTLPAAAAVGAVAFFSGSRALSEVQARRLAGAR